MPNIFDGFNSSAGWLDDFITSQAAADTKEDMVASWENDVITAVKAKRYTGLDEALVDLRQRTGLTETAMTDIRNGILKKTAADQEWHSVLGTSTPQLKKLAEVKIELMNIANEFDMQGNTAVSDAIDSTLDQLSK